MLRPWDSPGKNTGVGRHFLLQCMKVKSESEVSRSIVSDSQRPHGLQPTMLLRPWDFPGKSTGVGCHCLLWKMCLVLQIGKHQLKATAAAAAKSLQSCPTLCDPWTAAHQAPLSTGFSRQEYWSGVSFHSPGDLPEPGI